ncbi:hypothetical protein [Bradyrhizobium sp. CB3481]|uniref:hypothetical protein n=1 Tax=Bradyrhizobium sp. CB3481 TaxID=3039158 RepID=UPI0032C23CDF
MEVTSVVMEIGPVVGMTIAIKRPTYAITAATIDRRGAKAAAAVNRKPAASEPAAMECGAAASESTAVKSAATATKTTATVEASATTAEAATTAAAAMTHFGRKAIGCKFDGWSRAGTCERKRLGALL